MSKITGAQIAGAKELSEVRLSRFICITILGILLTFAWCLGAAFIVPDHQNISEPAYTLSQNAYRWAGAIAIWPLTVTMFLFEKMPILVLPTGSLLTGLFWAGAIEVMCYRKRLRHVQQ